MFRKAKEYSLNELIEHPVLSVQLATGGVERRCLDLILDLSTGCHRFAGTEYEEANQFLLGLHRRYEWFRNVLPGFCQGN